LTFQKKVIQTFQKSNSDFSKRSPAPPPRFPTIHTPEREKADGRGGEGRRGEVRAGFRV